MTRSLILATLALVLAVATACSSSGSDSGSSSQPAGDAPASSSSDATPAAGNSGAAPSGGGSGAEGTIQVNGKSFGVNEVWRCEPSRRDPNALELIAIGDNIQLFIDSFAGSIGRGEELSVQGLNAGGVFAGSRSEISEGTWTDGNGNSFNGPAFTVDGDKISGSMTLDASGGGSATAEISFNVSIPSNIRDC